MRSLMNTNVPHGSSKLLYIIYNILEPFIRYTNYYLYDFLLKDQQDDAVIIIGSVEDGLVDSVILGITNAGWVETVGKVAKNVVEPQLRGN